ncbi:MULTISPECIES: TetR/AcrR family transcriptional regulator [unclassified Nocardioides]|uniref:TetR/AcrR family transcriptional regulator n=1 Tax=unclassified Nocardioides TaxID=2615069 RepID=UPI0006FD2FB6|nr:MULTISPECIES: TetR/AcrR family transcriptional regulator [unclassified Nocardioides]KRA32543.1 hypothetical protein ASD81_13435 [Nocardioides sp. Root614]KRA89196.1 hypothetical protein ASD84_13700 [Nocardioides sp. Root682]
MAKSPSGTKGVPREEREAQILDIATEELGMHGYAHTSLTVVAQRAGISKPLIYMYFDSKDGLYLACLERAGDQIVEAVTAVQNGVALTRALDTVAAIFATLEPRRQDWAVLWDETLPPGSTVREAALQYRRKLIDLGSVGTHELLAARDNHDDLDASMMTEIWLNTVTTVVRWWLDHPEQDAATMTARCARLLAALQAG